MEALKQEVIIPPNHHLVLDLDIPPTVPVGRSEVIVIFQEPSAIETNAEAAGEEGKPRLKRLFATSTGILPDGYAFSREELHER